MSGRTKRPRSPSGEEARLRDTRRRKQQEQQEQDERDRSWLDGRRKRKIDRLQREIEQTKSEVRDAIRGTYGHCRDLDWEDELKEKRDRKVRELRNEIQKIARDRYYSSHGIPYGFHGAVDSRSIEYRASIQNNGDLLGTYDLVFYAMHHMSDTLPDIVQRTASGALDLRTTAWEGQTALYGCLGLDDRGGVPLVYEDGYRAEHDWMTASFVEAVTDRTRTAFQHHNGFRMFHFTHTGHRLLVLDRGIRPEGWHTFLKIEHQGHCGAKLRVVAERAPLGRSWDRLPLVGSWAPPPSRRGNGATYDARDAQNLLEAFERGEHHSWISRHLGLPLHLAGRIGSFVSPAPVWFLEPGDLVLQVDESIGADWHKWFVFRKSSDPATSLALLDKVRRREIHRKKEQR